MSGIGRVVFLGSKHIGLETLKTIWALSPETLRGVVTFDDSNDARSVLPQIKEFCIQAGLHIEIAKNRQATEEAIKAMSPDLCLVVGWYWLLSDSLIKTIPYGIIGAHSSLLPKYRGGSPLVWAMINGERETGFSIFSFVSDMDSGDIWLQEKVAISDKDTIASMLENIENKLLDSLGKNWCALLNGAIQPYAQDHSEATYCAQRMPDDGEIDWQLSAEDIYNFIRAQTLPYPGAFTVHNGKRINILNAELFSRPYYGTPGQIARVSVTEGVVDVICGDARAIILKTVSVDGEARPAGLVFPSIKIRLGC